jgi:beta-lactamase family protein
MLYWMLNDYGGKNIYSISKIIACLIVLSSSSVLLASDEINSIDSKTLPRLLKAREYAPPDTFKALIVEIIPDKNKGYRYFSMDYNGTSADLENWWPASTVKLFVAIAALEKSHSLGFTPKARLTFKYDEEPVTQTVEELVRRAITDSKNPEFDRLVEFVGFNHLNRRFLSKENGLAKTIMQRSYFRRVTYVENGKGSNRHSPPILVEQKKRSKLLSERTGSGEYEECPDQGNCTTLLELAEAMRRVMLHESLDEKKRYKLGKKELKLLRSALKGKHARGGVADALRAAFKDRPIEIYHKAGYADGWFSDNIFLRVLDTKQQWIIGMVNRPGRDSLNEAASHVAEMIAKGELGRRNKQ